MDSIINALQMIKEQIGVDLVLCDYFTGLNKHNGRDYFNVVLPTVISESKDFVLLESFCTQYKIFSVVPNGYKRIAIFLN